MRKKVRVNVVTDKSCPHKISKPDRVRLIKPGQRVWRSETQRARHIFRTTLGQVSENTVPLHLFHLGECRTYERDEYVG